MYLSRIQLNAQRRGAQRLLANPQRMHAAVLAAFPDPPTGEEAGGRVLWRVDREDRRVFLYVVSPYEACLLHVAEQAGWPATEPGASRNYETLLDRLAEGQRWSYRLTASPVRYLSKADGGRARRGAHVTAAQQEAWLLSKAEGMGVCFSLNEGMPPATLVTRRGTHSFRKGNGQQPVTISWAQYDGVLRITQATALRQSLVSGIGPGKAYGCGLMTLAMVQ